MRNVKRGHVFRISRYCAHFRPAHVGISLCVKPRGDRVSASYISMSAYPSIPGLAQSKTCFSMRYHEVGRRNMFRVGDGVGTQLSWSISSRLNPYLPHHLRLSPIASDFQAPRLPLESLPIRKAHTNLGLLLNKHRHFIC